MDQTNTFQSRKDAFFKEYGEAREKYQVDFMSRPIYVQGEDGSWKLIVQPEIVDLTAALTLSPFNVS